MNTEGISPSRQAEVGIARSRKVVKRGLSMIVAGVAMAATRRGLGKEAAEAGAAISFVGSFTASVAGAKLSSLRNRVFPERTESAEVIDVVSAQSEEPDTVGKILADLFNGIRTSNERQRRLKASASKRSRLVLYRQSEDKSDLGLEKGK